jgi:hypothetical protein
MVLISCVTLVSSHIVNVLFISGGKYSSRLSDIQTTTKKEQQAGANKTTSASRENNRPLLYKQGNYNTRTRQVGDAPVSEKVLKC